MSLGERAFYSALAFLQGVGWTLAFGSIGILFNWYGYEFLYYMAWIGGLILFWPCRKGFDEKSSIMYNNLYFACAFMGIGIGIMLIVSTLGLALNSFGFDLSFQIAIVVGGLMGGGFALHLIRSGN